MCRGFQIPQQTGRPRRLRHLGAAVSSERSSRRGRQRRDDDHLGRRSARQPPPLDTPPWTPIITRVCQAQQDTGSTRRADWLERLCARTAALDVISREESAKEGWRSRGCPQGAACPFSTARCMVPDEQFPQETSAIGGVLRSHPPPLLELDRRSRGGSSPA